MYTCMVIDDEHLAQERITDYLANKPDWQVVATASTYQNAYSQLLHHKPALCFVDINIIGGSGIDLVANLAGSLQTQWVFTTAYSEFALRAFELHALDYLLKPFEDHRLVSVLTAFRQRNQHDADILNTQRFAVKSVGAVEFVNASDIVWIKGSANYVELHTKDKVYLYRQTIGALEAQLDARQFVRVHRSAIVNIENIKALNSELGRYSLVVMNTGDEVSLSSSYRQTLFSNLGLELA